MNFQIIKVEPKDLSKLRALAIDTFVETFTKDNTPENMAKYVEESLNEAKVLSEIENPNSAFYIVKSADNEALAYLKVNFADAQSDAKDPESLEIERIYVRATFQGYKLGQKLFEKALEIAQTKQLKYVWLGVWDQNQKAIGFYKKCGFEAFDSHVFMLGDDKQTDILMRLYI